MRGLKKDDTGLIPGIRVYNNFIKKHIGLNGKTFAEDALILVKGKNKWTYYHPECLVSTRDHYNLLFIFDSQEIILDLIQVTLFIQNHIIKVIYRISYEKISCDYGTKVHHIAQYVNKN